MENSRIVFRYLQLFRGVFPFSTNTNEFYINWFLDCEFLLVIETAFFQFLYVSTINAPATHARKFPSHWRPPSIVLSLQYLTCLEKTSLADCISDMYLILYYQYRHRYDFVSYMNAVNKHTDTNCSPHG